jgi:single-strand DNA-binding protein
MPSQFDLDGDLRAEQRILMATVRQTIRTSYANVEDACQSAWLRLLNRPDVQASPTVRGWLTTVAIREALRLSRRDQRTTATTVEPAAPDMTSAIEAREALALVAGLCERDRQAIALQIAGLRYVEIAQCSGQTRRTVERRLLQARKTVRERARASGGRIDVQDVAGCGERRGVRCTTTSGSDLAAFVKTTSLGRNAHGSRQCLRARRSCRTCVPDFGAARAHRACHLTHRPLEDGEKGVGDMSSINRVIVTGRLTNDVTTRKTTGGTDVTVMRLAVARRKRDGADQPPVFIDVVAYGAQAVNCAKYLAQGSRIAVDGRIEYSEWQVEGQKRSKHEIVAQEVEFLSSARSQSPGNEQEAEPSTDAPDPEPDSDQDAEPTTSRPDRQPSEATA